MPDSTAEYRLQLLPALTVILVAVILALVATKHWLWPGLALSVEPTNVMATLAPLLLTAGFIERAVEVVISPWRDPEADRMETQLTHARKNPQGAATVAQLETALNRYRGQTKQYAFLAALGFGLAAAVAGVRALGAFAITDPGKAALHAADARQQAVFVTFDILLTTLLLAGGANGIHSVVNAFTTYFDTTAQKAQQSAAATSPSPAMGGTAVGAPPDGSAVPPAAPAAADAPA